MGTNLPCIGILSWGPGFGLGPLAPLRETSAAEILLLILTTTSGYGTSPSCVRAPPTSLHVTSSLYP